MRGYLCAEIEVGHCAWLKWNVSSIADGSNLFFCILMKSNVKICVRGILDACFYYVDDKHEFSFGTGRQGRRGRLNLMLDIEGSSDGGLFDGIKAGIYEQYK